MITAMSLIRLTAVPKERAMSSRAEEGQFVEQKQKWKVPARLTQCHAVQ